MKVSAVVIGIDDGPVVLDRMQFDPGEIYIGVGGLALYVREADIDRLSAALERAREVLKGSASESQVRESL